MTIASTQLFAMFDFSQNLKLLQNRSDVCISLNRMGEARREGEKRLSCQTEDQTKTFLAVIMSACLQQFQPQQKHISLLKVKPDREERRRRKRGGGIKSIGDPFSSPPPPCLSSSPRKKRTDGGKEKRGREGARANAREKRR